MVYQAEIGLSTHETHEVHDITRRVETIVHESGVKTGMVNVFNIGSTGAIGTIELEPGLVQDLPALLNRLIPPGQSYAHEQVARDQNAHSHLQATLIGPSVTVPVRDGEPVLGRWQQVFFLECDVKPRRRTILVTVQGE
jgi:secondary thiamine-phosphate synthase enzyme